MAGVNFAANFYDYGLGTRHGSIGQGLHQKDFVLSLSATGGVGQGKRIPLNTFNNNSNTGVENSIANSFSIGSNFVWNSTGRNQRVGYLNLRVNDVAFNIYNDFFPVLGDRYDRFWTGGGGFQLALSDSKSVFFGSDVFTTNRISDPSKGGSWLLDPSNPAKGKYGTYLHSASGQLLNNGQTQLKFIDGLIKEFQNISGNKHMYSQDGIHDYLTKNPLFFSSATEW